MSDIATLMERVERAEGPDTTLDRDIAIWACPEGEERRAVDGAPHTYLRHVTYGDGAEEWAHVRPNSYTDSIDTALALASHRLPGHRFALFTDGEGKGPFASVMIGDEPVVAGAHARSLPLALLSAALRALSTEGTQ